MAARLGGAEVICSETERLVFSPPQGRTCSAYMGEFIQHFGGYLVDSPKQQVGGCDFCPISNADAFLAVINVSYKNMWRDFAIMCCYIVFNFVACMGVYWLARVPKGRGR